MTTTLSLALSQQEVCSLLYVLGRAANGASDVELEAILGLLRSVNDQLQAQQVDAALTAARGFAEGLVAPAAVEEATGVAGRRDRRRDMETLGGD